MPFASNFVERLRNRINPNGVTLDLRALGGQVVLLGRRKPAVAKTYLSIFGAILAFLIIRTIEPKGGFLKSQRTETKASIAPVPLRIEFENDEKLNVIWDAPIENPQIFVSGAIVPVQCSNNICSFKLAPNVKEFEVKWSQKGEVTRRFSKRFTL